MSGSVAPLSNQIAGKTLLARTLAKVLDVPFSVSDATSFTQVSKLVLVVMSAYAEKFLPGRM